MHTGEGLHRFVDPVDGEVYLYTQFEVADSRRVFAVFEQPDLKATFAFTVTAPDDWQVISNAADAGAASRGSGEGGDLALRAHADASRRTSPRSVAGPYHRVDERVPRRRPRRSRSALYCRASLAAVPRRRQHLRR